MNELDDALTDLRAEIEKRGFSEELVEDIAGEYGLNPALVRRKFEEATGAAPHNWVPPQDMVALARKRAKKKARDVMDKAGVFELGDFGSKALSLIENKGAEYVFCGAQKLVPSHYTAAVKSTRPASFVAVETCMVFRADIPDNAEEFQKVVKLLAGPEDY